MVGVTEQTMYDAVSGMLLLEGALGLLITTLAMVGYRRNRSLPMLYLAVGIALLTFVQTAVSMLVGQLGPTYMVSVSTQAVALLGLLSILYSILLARRQ